MAYALIGNAAMLLHFAFLCYVVFGGFLALIRPKAFWPHLFVAAYALGIVLIDWPCFLTETENWARSNTGREVMEFGFIDHYLTDVVYPRKHLFTSRVVIAAIVGASSAGAAWRFARGRGDTARDGLAKV